MLCVHMKPWQKKNVFPYSAGSKKTKNIHDEGLYVLIVILSIL